MFVFPTAESAKQYFVERIEEQARRENTPLSDLELKMLRWAEQYPIPGLPAEELPALNREFEERYDSDEYEKRIAGLLLRAYEHRCKEGLAAEDWKAAYEVLSKEDHYILVMIDQSVGSKLKKRRFLGIL